MKREPIQSIVFKNASFFTANGQPVFENLNFSFPMGEVVWLKGQSGAGKSVILKMLCGLIMPSSGRILINGKVISDMTFEEFAPLRCNMGYSFDFGGLINNRNIRANLTLATEYHNFESGRDEEIVPTIDYYLEQFNLKSVEKERPSSIAGGLRKAACVARAFVHEPELLLLDDPSTGLRGDTCAKLIKLIDMKKTSGCLKHTIVASDDEVFMKKLNAKTIDMNELQIKSNKQVSVA